MRLPFVPVRRPARQEQDIFSFSADCKKGEGKPASRSAPNDRSVGWYLLAVNMLLGRNGTFVPDWDAISPRWNRSRPALIKPVIDDKISRANTAAGLPGVGIIFPLLTHLSA